jgi:hypothetical protein
MYVGFALGWIGLWIVFGHANPVAIAAVVAVALAVHLFVVFYKEPTLRKKFGRSTKSIAGTCDAGGRVCEAGTSRNDPQAPGT